MVKSSYYIAMSLTKQIIVAVIATVSLALFGVGSYYASKEIFPDPTTDSTSNPTTTTDPKVISVTEVEKLEPKNRVIRVEGDNTVVQFDTSEKVGVTFYVTPKKTDVITKVITDYQNGIAIPGKFLVVTANDATSTSHVAKIPKSMLATTGQTYYYVLLSYKANWLPYGDGMDYVAGPTEPYVLKAD